jgi:hypothetical protein
MYKKNKETDVSRREHKDRIEKLCDLCVLCGWKVSTI